MVLYLCLIQCILKLEKGTFMKKIFVIAMILSSFLYSVVYEDAEDGNVNRWVASAGTTVNNVTDDDTGSKVIKFSADSYQYYRMGYLASNSDKQIEWDIKTTSGFIAYIGVSTTNGGDKLFYYTMVNRDYGVTSSGIHHGLGQGVVDGEWHTITRDLEAELHESEPTNHITAIKWFKLRAINDVFVDNIKGLPDDDIDTTPPVITLVGDSNETIDCGEDYTEQGADALDNEDSDVNVSISGIVKTSNNGVYTITYSAVDSAGNSATSTRTVTVQGCNNNYSVIEDAEDGNINRWIASGVTVTNEVDTDTESRVIKLNSDVYKYSRINIPNGTESKTIKWDMKINEGFYVYIKVSTSKGNKLLYYNAINQDYGKTSSGIHYGLGTSATDNSWHTFERNIEEDIKNIDSNNSLISIDSFKIRSKGVVHIDNVIMGDETPILTPTPIDRKIGANNDINSTEISKGTVFISPGGTNQGQDCTKVEPCDFKRLDIHSSNPINLVAGDVVFFRGGVYPFSMGGVKRIYLKGGTSLKPIIYESYPGEVAIFDGSSLRTVDTEIKEWKEGLIHLKEDYTLFRKIEVRNMPEYGVRIIGGNHNIIEGCAIHHNHLSGIEICGYSALSNDKSACGDGGRGNIIRNNTIFENSDVGLAFSDYANGDNADGITIHSGVDNIISKNTIYSNSDDGVDTWHSMNTKVEYNLVYSNGDGDGNGAGIKLGGHPNVDVGSNALAQYNISCMNRKQGFNTNGGTNVVMKFNTTYHNGGCGYVLGDDSKLVKNISSLDNPNGASTCNDAKDNPDDNSSVGWDNGVQIDNSWQRDGVLNFISTDVYSDDFLKLTGENFVDIGAYAK